METRNKGLLLSLIGVCILSPDSLLIRLVNLDDFSLIFYRSLIPILSVVVFLLLSFDMIFCGCRSLDYVH